MFSLVLRDKGSSSVYKMTWLHSPAFGQVVDRGQPSREMVGLFIRRCHRHSKSKVFSYSRHGWNGGKRLVDWPLRTRANGWVQVPRPVVDIIAA